MIGVCARGVDGKAVAVTPAGAGPIVREAAAFGADDSFGAGSSEAVLGLALLLAAAAITAAAAGSAARESLLDLSTADGMAEGASETVGIDAGSGSGAVTRAGSGAVSAALSSIVSAASGATSSSFSNASSGEDASGLSDPPCAETGELPVLDSPEAAAVDSWLVSLAGGTLSVADAGGSDSRFGIDSSKARMASSAVLIASAGGLTEVLASPTVSAVAAGT